MSIIALNSRSSTRGAILALIGVATLVLAACGGDGGSSEGVIYVTSGDNNHVFTISVEGEPEKLINDPATAPQWAPNARQIAYLTNVDADGGRLKYWDRETNDKARVPDAPDTVSRFFWSPDSRKISYQALSGDGANTQVYVHDFEAEETTLLVDEPVGNVELGNWSGDNLWVVARIDFDDTQGVYMRSVQGVNEVQLTDYPDTHPRFSPDGTRVALNRHHDDGTSDIYVLTVDTGSGPSAAAPLADDDGNESDFEWSPDGKQIAYVSDRDGNSEIYAVDTGNKATRRLTENRVPDSAPRWSSDSKRIMFTSDVNGKLELFSMTFSDGQQKRVFATDHDIIAADW